MATTEFMIQLVRKTLEKNCWQKCLYYGMIIVNDLFSSINPA